MDLNPRVGNEVIEGIVGQHGVRGRESGVYWRCVQRTSLWWVTVGSRKRIYINTRG